MFIQVIPTSTASTTKLQISQPPTFSRGLLLGSGNAAKGIQSWPKQKKSTLKYSSSFYKTQMPQFIGSGWWLEDTSMLTLAFLVWIRKAATDIGEIQREKTKKLSILTLSWIVTVNPEGKTLRLANCLRHLDQYVYSSYTQKQVMLRKREIAHWEVSY